MTESRVTRHVQGETAMLSFGADIAAVLESGTCIFLQGDLGVGKTTLCRGVLQGLGITGSVKSPTYTLIEPYEVGDRQVFHFDLYRLAGGEELEYLGAREYFESGAICLVEWPEKAEGYIAGSDVLIEISGNGDSRACVLQGFTSKGISIINQL